TGPNVQGPFVFSELARTCHFQRTNGPFIQHPCSSPDALIRRGERLRPRDAVEAATGRPLTFYPPPDAASWAASGFRRGSGAMDELDLGEVEREICRLPDVSIARLVAEPDGRVSEVHVVAHPGKHPKQIVRDVQSIALASFGLEFDRRIVS